MTTRPFFSVIVPTYNRPQHLAPLLDSVLSQSFTDWEVVIGEDCSPARAQVRAIVEEYSTRTNGRVRCEFHAQTLGYDGNLRTLIRLARGKYVFVMGDDDYVAPNAFNAAAKAIARHPNTGMILRAFAWFVGDRDNVIRITRYYPHECTFPPGRDAILACYRRVVCMSGLVIDRDLAAACETDRWDGSLFYQHWVIGNVLAKRNAVYIPDLLAYFRQGSPRSFGTAAAERHLYTPGTEPPETTYKGLHYQFAIAQTLEKQYGIPLMNDLLRDYANYTFPQFAMHSKAPFREYYAFYRRLGRLGLSRYLGFHVWFWTVALFGAANVERVLDLVRRRLGHTPNLTRAVRSAFRPRSTQQRTFIPQRTSGAAPAISSE
jgi:glycosyltransferase involved in cell wall biosynthesis